MTQLQRIACFCSLLAMFALPGEGDSQSVPSLDVQLHLGKARGYVKSITYGADLALNVSGAVALEASAARWQPFNVGCVQVWPDSYACSFHGNSIAVGPRVRLFRDGDFDIFGAFGIGLFTHADNLVDETVLAIPVRLGFHMRVSEGWFLVPAVRRLWIVDDRSRDLLGEHPRYTGFTVGLQRRISLRGSR